MRKKTLFWILVFVLLGLLIVAGVVFAILRPEYLQEALEILFKPEL